MKHLIGYRIFHIESGKWQNKTSSRYSNFRIDNKYDADIFKTLGACKTSLYGFRRRDPNLEAFEFIPVYECEDA